MQNDRFERSFKSSRIVPGSAEENALKAMLRELKWKRLPLPGSYTVPMLPLADLLRWGHDVPNTTLRVLYDFDDEQTKLYLISVTRRVR
jgi:hypothetical protein